MMRVYRAGPTTERLEMRAMSASDADAYFQLRTHPDVIRYTGDEPLDSVAAATDAILNYPDFETIGYGRWGCFLRGTRQMIGFCGLKHLADLNIVDVGYRFLPEYWRQGLATEACRATIAFGHDVIGIRDIYGLVLPGNMRSIRVLEKSGLSFVRSFSYEGFDAVRMYASISRERTDQSSAVSRPPAT